MKDVKDIVKAVDRHTYSYEGRECPDSDITCIFEAFHADIIRKRREMLADDMKIAPDILARALEDLQKEEEEE